MPHPHLEERRSSEPRDVHKMHKQSLSFNENVIVFVAGLLGSPWTFYVFCLLALISAPQVFESGNVVTIISWVTQTFIQLVALAVLQAFQTITGKKLDKMLVEMFRNSKLAYKDAEVLLKLVDEVHSLIKVNNQLTEEIHARGDKTPTVKVKRVKVKKT
jgi:low affinity Fe/Cu permease